MLVEQNQTILILPLLTQVVSSILGYTGYTYTGCTGYTGYTVTLVTHGYTVTPVTPSHRLHHFSVSAYQRTSVTAYQLISESA